MPHREVVLAFLDGQRLGQSRWCFPSIGVADGRSRVSGRRSPLSPRLRKAAGPRPTRGTIRAPHIERTASVMLNWAVTFAVLAIIAAVLGLGGIAGDFAYIAKILI